MNTCRVVVFVGVAFFFPQCILKAEITVVSSNSHQSSCQHKPKVKDTWLSVLAVCHKDKVWQFQYQFLTGSGHTSHLSS